nr:MULTISPECIES: 2-oxo acid dehydrogenase subunit E2 [Halomicrobium]
MLAGLILPAVNLSQISPPRGGEYLNEVTAGSINQGIPIINVRQTAILGTGALKERPVAEDGETRAQRGSPNGERGPQRPASGEVVARATLPLSLAIDLSTTSQHALSGELAVEDAPAPGD